jgi:hypothetical protein
LQPTGDPHEYPMVEYDLWKWDYKMILFHFKWNFRTLPLYIPGKHQQPLTLLLNLAEDPRRSLSLTKCQLFRSSAVQTQLEFRNFCLLSVYSCKPFYYFPNTFLDTQR